MMESCSQTKGFRGHSLCDMLHGILPEDTGFRLKVQEQRSIHQREFIMIVKYIITIKKDNERLRKVKVKSRRAHKENVNTSQRISITRPGIKSTTSQGQLDPYNFAKEHKGLYKSLDLLDTLIRVQKTKADIITTRKFASIVGNVHISSYSN